MRDLSTTVAVIGGSGGLGTGLALRWAAAGLTVVLGSRDAARAEAAASSLRDALAAHPPASGPQAPGDGGAAGDAPARQPAGAGTVSGSANADAARGADIVVLAVPFGAQRPTLAGLREALHPGQVLVDATVPLATAAGGRPTELLGVWAGSAAQQAAANVPPGVDVVSAFHTVSAAHLQELGHRLDGDVIVCGDRREARERVRPLVEALPGCRFVDGGPLANSRYVEALTPLLIGLNGRYHVSGCGIHITGLAEAAAAAPKRGAPEK